MRAQMVLRRRVAPTPPYLRRLGAVAPVLPYLALMLHSALVSPFLGLVRGSDRGACSTVLMQSKFGSFG